MVLVAILICVGTHVMAALSSFYNSTGVATAWFDADGNLIIPNGTLTEDCTSWLTGFEGFKVCNTSGNKIATIETSTGNVNIAGDCYEQQSSLTPTNAPYVVKNSNSEVVAYLDNSGNLCLKGRVYKPEPVNGTTGCSTTMQLSWPTGSNATSYDVYFGTDENMVNNADYNSTTFKGNQTTTIFEPGMLSSNTVYYWRVDQIGSTCIIKGQTWSFSTIAVYTDPQSLNITLSKNQTATRSITIYNNENLAFDFFTEIEEFGTTASNLGPLGPMEPTKIKENYQDNLLVFEYVSGMPEVVKYNKYTEVEIGGLPLYQITGAPMVPIQPISVLIPYGKEIERIKVKWTDKNVLEGCYYIKPAQACYPLSYEGKIEETPPDLEVYSIDAEWPQLDYELLGVSNKCGYTIADFVVFPVKYNPKRAKITYTTKYIIEIKFKDENLKLLKDNYKKSKSFANNKLFRNGIRVDKSESSRKYLKQSVGNFNAVSTYSQSAENVAGLMTSEDVIEGGVVMSSVLSGGPYEYVIITNQSMANASGPYNFQALRDHYLNKGISTTIVTTEWIYANYDGTKPSGGSDNQTRIRNFIKDAYNNWETKYVLLGGDESTVPKRFMYVAVDYYGWTAIASDIYYSCLDGDFDSNQNGLYGEKKNPSCHWSPYCGESDVLDNFAEVYIGRATVDTPTELANFIRKTLSYDAGGTNLDKVCMLGERMDKPEHLCDSPIYAKECMEIIKRCFYSHIYYDLYTFDTTINLYDWSNWHDEWNIHYWTKSDLLNLINSGKHIFNHMGHANEECCMRLYISDVINLTNNQYFFVNSQGCYAGDFSGSNDCIAEKLLYSSSGAFAVVMNTSYGWWNIDHPTNGVSQIFQRGFWNSVLYDRNFELGKALQESKEDIWFQNNYYNWCNYAITLFGDPHQQLLFGQQRDWFIISVTPEMGAINSNSSAVLQISFDAYHFAPGVYQKEIALRLENANASNPSYLVIPVTFTITP